MFSLFHTILAGPYLFYKGASDKGKKVAAEKKLVELETITSKNVHEWEAAVTDVDLEKTIMRAVREGSKELYRYWDEISETADEVWGCYATTHQPDYIADLDAARILMANRGRLLARDARMGISSTNYNYRGARMEKEVRNVAVLSRWINQKLRDHGIDEQLLTDGPGARGYYVIDDATTHCSVDEYEGYNFVWKPMVDVRYWPNIMRYKT